MTNSFCRLKVVGSRPIGLIFLSVTFLHFFESRLNITIKNIIISNQKQEKVYIKKDTLKAGFFKNAPNFVSVLTGARAAPAQRVKKLARGLVFLLKPAQASLERQTSCVKVSLLCCRAGNFVCTKTPLPTSAPLEFRRQPKVGRRLAPRRGGRRKTR